MISPNVAVRRGMDRISDVDASVLLTVATGLGVLGVGALVSGRPWAAVGCGSAEWLAVHAARRSDHQEQLALEAGQYLTQATQGSE